jgi:hypothetical protein
MPSEPIQGLIEGPHQWHELGRKPLSLKAYTDIAGSDHERLRRDFVEGPQTPTQTEDPDQQRCGSDRWNHPRHVRQELGQHCVHEDLTAMDSRHSLRVIVHRSRIERLSYLTCFKKDADREDECRQREHGRQAPGKLKL